MKKIIILILITTIYGAVFAQDFKKTGTAGYVFLELPVTARATGLGECSISLADMNSSAVFSNPGALGFTQQKMSFSATYAPWIADIKNYATSISYKTQFGVFGFGAVMVDYGTMPRTVKLSGQRVYEQIGTFSANSMSLGLTYSKQLTEKFSFGVTAKYVKETIDVYNAGNMLIDGGIIYYTGLSSLRLGAVIQNFGTNTKFINSEFKMPVMLRIGAAAEVYQNDDNKVTLIVEALHPTDSNEKLNVGTEIELMKVFTLRAGYKFFYDEEKYSFGIGLKPPVDMPVYLDFSYANYNRLGNLLRFTLQLGVL
ncbi:MAG: PorV/PorQ family protein [Bacteroidota bacterium]|nr:PorV/PorQ family protein [Bacteroidota bacterium]